jgi:hypothetical protein
MAFGNVCSDNLALLADFHPFWYIVSKKIWQPWSIIAPMSCKSYLTYEAFMHECMHVRRMGGHAGSPVQPYE